MKILFLFLVLISLVTLADTKVIYGIDNRYEIVDQLVPHKELGQAVAAMVSDNKIFKNKNDSFSIRSFYSFGQRFHLCKDERFYDQPSLGTCTGFLVAPDILVTAGHCIDLPYYNGVKPDTCNDYKWIFDYDLSHQYENKEISVSQVHSCKEVLYLKHDTFEDLAIIKLDRAVKGVTPLKFSQVNVKKNDTVFVIGHPSGLPKKITTGGSVIKTQKGSKRFYIAADVYEGNSGSPVLNKQGEVLGVLLSGRTDFHYDDEKQCQKSNVCSEGDLVCDYAFDYSYAEGVGKYGPQINKVIKGL
jgi:S1-C subfamily serine protease